MKAKLSPLSWINFALLQSQFEFIQPEIKGKSKRKIDPQSFFSGYEIDIDFSNLDVNENGDFQAFTKIEINNNENPYPGYKILVEGTGVFRIDQTIELLEEHKKNLQNYSAVNLLINRLRTHILQMTSLSVFGAYDLPPIDITDLYKQKEAELK